MPPPSQTRAYASLLIIVAFWGSYPATAKLALADFPPLLLGALRSLLALLFLGVFRRRQVVEAARTVTRNTLPGFAFLTLTGVFLGNSVVYLAISLTTASNTTILQATMPALVALGARLYLGERLRPGQWLGVGCSAMGVLIVVTRGGWVALQPANLHVGDFLMLFAMAAWSANTVYGKRLLAIYSPDTVTIVSYMLSTILLVPVAFATAPLFPPPRLASRTAWGVVLYHALPGAVAHIVWYEAIKAVGPSRSAIFINIQPVVGVLLAAGLLGETITLSQVLGGLAVLIGVALTTRPKRAAGER